MSYHIPHIKTTNNYTLTQSSHLPQLETDQKERSNSSGKKILFIKRKLSNPSMTQPSYQQNPSLINNQHTHQHQEYLQNSHHTTKSHQQPYYKQPSTSSTIKTNHKNPYEQINTQKNTTTNIVQESSSQYSTKQSRGQQYEEQLEHIHQELRFFTHRLQEAENKNTLINNSLMEKQHQIQYLLKNVYACINRLFVPQLDTLYESMSSYLHSEDKIQFYNLVQKSSGANHANFNLTQFETDLLVILKTLNLILLNRNHLESLVNSQKITLSQNMKQIHKIQNQNQCLSHDCRVLQKDLNEKSKIRLVTRQIQTITIKAQQKPLDESKKTADRSRQDIKPKQCINAQTQTQQKRIGSAESVHKYKPLRYEGIPYRSSPYKNYIRERSASSGSKTESSLGSTIRKELRNEEIKKKSSQQVYINREQGKKPIQTKKLPATSSYLNHLIQSDDYIKASVQASHPSNIFISRNNRFEQQLDNSKSQLSLRRPPLRGRSQSQQQVPNSRQHTNSKQSMNNTPSRVVSAYSLNPVNQYGEKRLCNEMNGKKVRKIAQLSQESDSLSDKMRELVEEEEMLKLKYKELEQVKVSRQNKNSKVKKSAEKKY